MYKETVRAVVTDVCHSVMSYGFKWIILNIFVTRDALAELMTFEISTWFYGDEKDQWYEFTDRKVHGSNPTSASELPYSRLGRPDSIQALVLSSGDMATRHPKVPMFQFYLGLYGLAALFCLLGYIYAWIDWALRNRSTGRPAVTHISTSDTVSSHVDSNGEIATCALAVDIPVQDQQQAFEEKHTTEAPPLDECLNGNGKMEESSPATEEQKKSWNERRRERRQRYKREKLQKQMQREEEKRLLSLEESQNEDSMNSEADLSADEEDFSDFVREILQAHEMCSRRESIQVTDLDDKLCNASIHVVERVCNR
ncbi:hypothetical protein CSKR_108171 [Clonorchis sinensis]|uniref:Uncharacterized protein n=1 Tax=Clonorchis sinensis TaxID=79923 RepID=A0A3R7EX14_CLOSI|nr:hypothetical protein CSKR_108171 [Clonorchis sinensis]